MRCGSSWRQARDDLIERVDRLERRNRRFRREIEALKAGRGQQEDAPPPAPELENAGAGVIRFDSEYRYEILDPTTRLNPRQRLMLDRGKDGTLAPGRLHVQGAVTAIANHQSSNGDDKFGYRKGHPTASNQIGKTADGAMLQGASCQHGTGYCQDFPWLTSCRAGKQSGFRRLRQTLLRRPYPEGRVRPDHRRVARNPGMPSSRRARCRVSMSEAGTGTTGPSGRWTSRLNPAASSPVRPAPHESGRTGSCRGPRSSSGPA